MIRPSNIALTLSVTVLTTLTLACAPATATHAAASDSITSTTTAARSHPSSDRRATQPAQPTTTATTPAWLPTDLHFTPADIQYLRTLNSEDLAIAIQRQRDNIAALQEAAKLKTGYTDSLEAWSISTKKAR